MIYLVTNQNLNTTYELIDVDKSLRLLNSLSIIGLDTETSGLDPWTKELKLLQLGCKDFQVVIDCTTVDIHLYKELLESDRLFVFWNAKFDLKWLYKYRIVPKKVYDGFLAEQLFYFGYPRGYHSMSLKSATKEYLNVDLDKSVRGEIIYSSLNDRIIEYSARDVEFLEDIMNCQLSKAKEMNLTTAIDIENRFVLPLSYMEYCGIKLDVEKWKAKMQKDKARLIEAEHKLNSWILENLPNSEWVYVNLQGDLFEGFDLSPKVKINWNSSQQVAKILKSLGVDLQVKDKATNSYKDSVDVKVLKPQQDKCSLIPLLIEYSKAAKVTSTYGDNFLAQINPVSGRIHTNYQQLGAYTTRITSGGKDKNAKIEYVNLLNLPSDAETRECFCAEEGNKWISVDYSGQESFLMASISGDKAILNELINGDKDLHTLTAKIVFPYIPKDMSAKEVKKKFHKERQLAKGYEFAFNYGGTAFTIKRNFGLTDTEANRIYNSYMSGFNGLKRYQDFRKRDWLDKGYILISPLTGHRVFIPEWKEIKNNPRDNFRIKSDYDRSSVNYPIQGAGSMCLRFSLINFFYWLRDNDLLFKVLLCVAPYDEINCEAPEKIANKVAAKLQEFMKHAGSIFCTKCTLDSELSTLENGELPTYWIH